MPANEEMMAKIDAAAGEAEKELKEKYTGWSANDLIDWWARWYMKAGHKRLGRVLVSISKG
jgi:hypothetical protein